MPIGYLISVLLPTLATGLAVAPNTAWLDWDSSARSRVQINELRAWPRPVCWLPPS